MSSGHGRNGAGIASPHDARSIVDTATPSVLAISETELTALPILAAILVREKPWPDSRLIVARSAGLIRVRFSGGWLVKAAHAILEQPREALEDDSSS